MQSLLAVIEQLRGQEGGASQLLVATRAPLILASLEPMQALSTQKPQQKRQSKVSSLQMEK